MRNLRRHDQLFVLVCAICTFWVPTASATYRLTDLGHPAGYYGSAGYAINNSGMVVGEIWTMFSDAFYFNGAPMINIGTLGGTYAGSRGINASGQVVGYAQISLGYDHAFLWYGGVMSDLGTLTLTPNAESCANAINGPGQASGWSWVASGATHAFSHSGGAMQDLGTLGGTNSLAFGMNDHGYVVGSSDTLTGGTHPFLFQMMGIPLLDLGTLGGTNASANAINSSGVVVGYSDMPNGNQHAFFWNGHMNDLGTLGGNYASANGINVNGAIVGASNLVPNGPAHGFVAYCHNRLVDLNTMLDASGAGFTIVDARAINDIGQIAANAKDSSGGTHAVLLTFNGRLSC